MTAANLVERVFAEPFGQLPDGRAVTLYTLSNARGAVVKITDFGAIITQLHVPDRDGVLADVVLGFDTLAPYLDAHPYIGAAIGRYGNRIAGGRFTLDGEAFQVDLNDGVNHLHGGTQGLHTVLWQGQADQDGLTLTYRSPDGEQGYPGNLDVTLRYALTDDNELCMRWSALTDRATPVNLTQHSYFNLGGGGDILGHELTIRANAFTPIDEALMPLGALAPVAGTPFDFRSPRPIGERVAQRDKQLRHGSGYDHNFVLDKLPGSMDLAARVRDPGSGRIVEFYTVEPGLQFYSGNFLDGSLNGKGRSFDHRGAFCLEPQHFPNSPNRPDFPATILRPGEQYTSESRFKFSAD